MKKIIDGKVYYLFGSWATKIDAQEGAKRLRKQGNKARHIIAPRYYIYRHQVWTDNPKYK